MENPHAISNPYALIFGDNDLYKVEGKIMEFFYMSDQREMTFEDIIKGVGVSKGAVSKALKILISRDEIGFRLKKNNKRKRYFFLNISGWIGKAEKLIDDYLLQNRVLEEILSTRIDDNGDLNDFIKNSINFNRDMIEHIKKTKEKHFNH